MHFKKEKQTALQAAKQAGRILLHYYGKKEKIRQKPNKSLVAEADIGANSAIINIIKKYFPSHSILSEETGTEDNKSAYRWIIDPLDGTHNFLRGIPVFGTSIALEYKNEVVLGILYFPVLCITAVAEKGKGAFLNGKRISVSGKKDLEHAFVLFEYAYSNREQKIEFLKSLINRAIDVRNFGSAIYDLLLLASGRCEGMVILSTYPWDVAAGFLLAEEAGGRVTGLDGKKYDLKESKFVASNGRVHERLLKYIK